MIQTDQKYCPKCLVKAPWPEKIEKEKEPVQTKHNAIIKAKIDTKQDSVDSISQIGPTLVMIFGVLVCIVGLLTVIGVIVGLIILGAGWWWSDARSKEKIKLLGEIEELEAEMD